MSDCSQPLPIDPLRGAVDLHLPDLPGSKSLTNRMLLLAALADGDSVLSDVLLADDTRVMLDALQRLGFKLTLDEKNKQVRISGSSGVIPASEAELFLGNAGTAMRFLAAACCLGRGRYRLDGVARMRQRPIGQLVEPLQKLGAVIRHTGDPGCPPLEIQANGLAGGTIEMPPTLSSQYISALLQIGPYTGTGVRLKFSGPLISRPYITMTLATMAQFGARYRHEPDDSLIEVPAFRGYGGRTLSVEPDASNASYFLAAAAIMPGSRCRIDRLGSRSVQGDARFAGVLAKMGAGIQVAEDHISVQAPASGHLKGIDIDLNAMPDMVQTLAVAALFAEGKTVIRNVGNLRVKETDRLAALENELSRLGAGAVVEGDNLHITPAPLKPADIHTYDDHRMAMAFSLAGLRSPGVRICDPACVNKTFPEYWDYLDRLRG